MKTKKQIERALVQDTDPEQRETLRTLLQEKLEVDIKKEKAKFKRSMSQRKDSEKDLEIEGKLYCMQDVVGLEIDDYEDYEEDYETIYWHLKFADGSVVSFDPADISDGSTEVRLSELASSFDPSSLNSTVIKINDRYYWLEGEIQSIDWNGKKEDDYSTYFEAYLVYFRTYDDEVIVVFKDELEPFSLEQLNDWIDRRV